MIYILIKKKETVRYGLNVDQINTIKQRTFRDEFLYLSKRITELANNHRVLCDRFNAQKDKLNTLSDKTRNKVREVLILRDSLESTLLGLHNSHRAFEELLKETHITVDALNKFVSDLGVGGSEVGIVRLYKETFERIGRMKEEVEECVKKCLAKNEEIALFESQRKFVDGRKYNINMGISRNNNNDIYNSQSDNYFSKSNYIENNPSPAQHTQSEIDGYLGAAASSLMQLFGETDRRIRLLSEDENEMNDILVSLRRLREQNERINEGKKNIYGGI